MNWLERKLVRAVSRFHEVGAEMERIAKQANAAAKAKRDEADQIRQAAEIRVLQLGAEGKQMQNVAARAVRVRERLQTLLS